MKRIIFVFLLFCIPGSSFAGGYVFFLHNMYAELHGTDVSHPEYGKVEYYQVLERFRKEGFTVISELRAKNTDGRVYAAKVAKQVDSLLGIGVKPEDITIVGTSKGGYIAQFACGILKNEKLNFVFIGSCSGDEGLQGVNYYGNILSIREQSDEIGKTCKGMQKSKGNRIGNFKEIELNTGLKHGFLFRAMPEWLNPSIKWARHNYE
jgi:hypothetical protein